MGVTLNVLINAIREFEVIDQGRINLLSCQLLILFRNAINAADIAICLHDQADSDARMPDAWIAAGYARCFPNCCIGHTIVAWKCHVNPPIEKPSVTSVSPLTVDWIVVNHIQPIAVLLPGIERLRDNPEPCSASPISPMDRVQKPGWVGGRASLLPSPLRTGRATFMASGSSKSSGCFLGIALFPLAVYLLVAVQVYEDHLVVLPSVDVVLVDFLSIMDALSTERTGMILDARHLLFPE